MSSLPLFGKDKTFGPLFWTQFLGALNDNFFKNALVMMVTFKSVSLLGMDTKSLVAFLGGIFILPFFLFSPLAGQLSDRYSKTQIVVWTKIWELVIMIVGVVGFLLPSFELLTLVLFLMGTQSAFFGPAKYSILPELIDQAHLIKGNAYVEMGTFLAILIGTITGGIVAGLDSNAIYISAGILIFAIFGIWMAKKVPQLKSVSPDLKINFNPIPELGKMWRLLREKEAVFNSALGISWFWFLGAAILSLLPLYCKDYLRADATVVTAFMAMFTIGIGLGSIGCEKLSFHRVEIGLVPIGSLGMSIFLLDLSLVPITLSHEGLNNLASFLREPYALRLMFDLFVISIFGGFFTVPLYTLMQQRSHRESRSQVVAGNNVMNALFMVASALLIMVFHSFQFSLPQIFLILSVINIAVAIYIYSIVPEFVLRFYSWILVHVLYRLKIKGLENVPKDGAALLICNHVSYIDWLIISGAVPRPARFIMYYKFFDVPILKKLMIQAKVIPIAGFNESKKILEDAMEEISLALKAGDIVCIFPEGALTRSNEIAAFKTGIEKILARDPVPVVPMALDNLWGSLFSRSPGSLKTKFPGKLWQSISLKIGKPISPTLSAEQMRGIVQELLNG